MENKIICEEKMEISEKENSKNEKEMSGTIEKECEAIEKDSELRKEKIDSDSESKISNKETSSTAEIQDRPDVVNDPALEVDKSDCSVVKKAIVEEPEVEKKSDMTDPKTSDDAKKKTEDMNPEDLLNLLKSLSPEKLNQIKNKVFEIAEEKQQRVSDGESSNRSSEQERVKPANKEQEKESLPMPVDDDDDVICLDSDEDEPMPTSAQASSTASEKPQERKKDSSTTMSLTTAVKLQLKECINPECPRNPNDEYTESPVFVMNIFYIARKPNKSQWVCSSCLNEAYDVHEQLCTNINNNIPWTSVKIPKKKDLVEISDSDDENDPNTKKNLSLPETDFIVFNQETEMEVEEILNEIINRVDIKMQLDNEYQEIENRMKSNERNLKDIDEQLRVIEHKSQVMYNELYDINRPKIERRPSFHVEFSLTSAQQTQLTTEVKSPMVKSVYFNRSASSTSSTTAATVNRTVLQHVATHNQLEFNAFAAKPRPAYSGAMHTIAQWLTCKFIEEITVNDAKHVKVRFSDSSASEPLSIVSGKEFAFDKTSETLEIGARVIAKFPRTSRTKGHAKGATILDRYLPGVVGEKLTNYNKKRYLIFCDYGQVKYCPPSEVRQVLECSSEVWDDVHVNLRQFIRDYLISRKEEMKSRAMLNLQVSSRILVEQANDWRQAIVQEVDCSLVKIYFPHNKTYEWLYRGSKRLHQIYLQAAKSNSTTQRSAFRRDPGISYYAIDDDNDDSNSSETKKNIAKKSTGSADNAQQQSLPAQQMHQPSDKVIILNDDKIYLEDPIHVGKVRHYTPKSSIKPRKYVKHDCSEKCIATPQNDLSSFSPLAKPLLACWERQIVRHKNNRWVVYKAPCGRRMRNMLEIFNYLRLTKSNLNVDNFDLENVTQVLATYTIQHAQCGYYHPDCSGGKEGMKIPVVNAFDEQVPPPLKYSSHRIPMPGVKINTDPEFMSCCDCTDDCVDKNKCACFQLTIQGAKKLMTEDGDDISYVWKRLAKNVPTGIYECNSRCKCSTRCLNKVVQQPISVKMQLYRTKKRGWGLKSLHDIPKGTFICIYAGNLYTEKDANALCQGLEHGDEYFAELDLIEVVEGMKEGYEVGPKYPDTDDEKPSDSDSDYDESKDKNNYTADDGDFVARKVTKSSAGGREILTRSSKTSIQSDNSINRNNSEDSSDHEMVNLIPAPNTRIPLRKLFGPKERTYIMDAKQCGNIGRYFNHSCEPNLYVQNVFVDTHDLRFPWIAFFTSRHIKAGEELTWNYHYEIGSVPSKVLYCHCGAKTCIGRIL